jgi:hypothetical protein
VRGILSDARGKLADVFQNSVERNQHLSASRWLRYEDTCSKAFFDFHRIGKKKTLLRELETEEGTVTGQSDLALYVTSYYANLYSSDALAPGTAEAQAVCWKSVLSKVTQAMNERLTRDLSLRDISDTIKALPKGCPWNSSKNSKERWHRLCFSLSQRCSELVKPRPTSTRV